MKIIFTIICISGGAIVSGCNHVGSLGEDTDDTSETASSSDTVIAIDSETDSSDTGYETDSETSSSEPIVLSGSFLSICLGLDAVTQRASIHKVYGLAYEVISIAWRLSDIDSTVIRINAPITYASDGSGYGPGTYEIDATQASGATCQFCISTESYGTEAYQAIPDSGFIHFNALNTLDPVGEMCAGNLSVEMQEGIRDPSTLKWEAVPDGCTGTLFAEWSGLVEPSEDQKILQ